MTDALAAKFTEYLVDERGSCKYSPLRALSEEVRFAACFADDEASIIE